MTSRRTPSDPSDLPRQRSLWDDLTDEPGDPVGASAVDEVPVDSGVSQPSGPSHGAAVPRVVVASSSIALEEALVRTIDDLQGGVVNADGTLSPRAVDPVRVIVPSSSLRNHVVGALARRTERPWIGITCQTHQSAARDVLVRRGLSLATSGDLTALLARRYAQGERALARRLAHLNDGWGAVVGSVRDFLDAGLDPAHVDALLELLAAEGSTAGSYAEVERAAAVVRTAARTGAGHVEIGVLPASGIVTSATEALVGDGGGNALRSRAVLVYGYADATGATTEFLRALLSTHGGTLFVERPHDPADPGSVDRGYRVSERFLERVRPPHAVEAPAPAASRAPVDVAWAAFRALGTDAESREVAARCRARIDNGARPEGIAIVARNLGAYAIPLRRHLHRLGVPYSGVGAHGPPEPFARRVEALLDLVRERQRLRLDRWFELVAASALEAPRADLKLALAAAGRTRLVDLAALDVGHLAHGRERVALPIRVGIIEETDRRHPQSRAPRRTIAAAALRSERERAGRALALLEESRPLAEWLGILPELLGDELVALPGGDRARFLATIARAFGGLPGDLTLTHGEFATLIERPLRDEVDRPFGGAGGGVQILDVTESRGRTYDELFLIGMNRGVFPRTIQPDPLFPDPLRELIARSGHGLLPDLPVKRTGFDEERFLFAQLLGAAPRVTLSWLDADAEGRPAPPSPLVERLQWSGRLDDEVPLFSEPYARPERDQRAPWERGVRVALDGDLRALASFLPIVGPHAEPATNDRWAAARAAVLAELSAGPGSPAADDLGPYLGFIGPAGPDDPRRARSLFVTTLERVARCPWNAFLEKLLALETYPDPFDVLPRVDALRIGALIHRALERIGAPVGDLPEERAGEPPGSLAHLATAQGHPIDWSGVDFDRALRAAADDLVRELGTPAPGFAAALARAGRPFLNVARRVDEASPLPIVGVEVFGEVEVAPPSGEAITLHFRADRVERFGDHLRWTDFKTGRPFSDKKMAKTRAAHLRKKILAGEALQGTAYAHARGGEDRGNYVFLRPDLPTADEERRVTIDAGDEAVGTLFRDAVLRLAGAWYDGTLFPRLSLPGSNERPPACDHCDVAEACLQGDSGSRTRLRDWFAESRPTELPDAERLHALWFQGEVRDPGGDR